MANMKDLKKTLMDTVSGVADFTKDLAVNVGDKAKTLSRIAKLNMELNAEKDNLERAYSEIGKLYYEINNEQPGEFFIQLFDQVRFAGDHIDAIEEEIAALKAAGAEGDLDFEEVVYADEESATCCDANDEACCEAEENSIVVEIVEEKDPETPAE